jgi:hypothetical protein
VCVPELGTSINHIVGVKKIIDPGSHPLAKSFYTILCRILQPTGFDDNIRERSVFDEVMFSQTFFVTRTNKYSNGISMHLSRDRTEKLL